MEVAKEWTRLARGWEQTLRCVSDFGPKYRDRTLPAAQPKMFRHIRSASKAKHLLRSGRLPNAVKSDEFESAFTI
jgi:hypothetical protein